MFKCVKSFLSLESLCTSEFGHVFRGKSCEISIKLCCFMYHQQVNEMFLNGCCRKNKLWKERNLELAIANKLSAMFHQFAKSVQ